MNTLIFLWDTKEKQVFNTFFLDGIQIDAILNFIANEDEVMRVLITPQI